MSEKQRRGQVQGIQPPPKRSRPFWWLVAVPVLVVAFVISTGANFLSIIGSKGASGSTVSVEPPVVAGSTTRRAPDFSVTTIEGSRFRLADQKGRAVVVLFTAPG